MAVSKRAVQPQSCWWSQVQFQKRRKGRGGYVVRVGQKLGDLSFTYHESRPLPVRAQAEAYARAVVAGFEAGKPVQAVVWWTYRVVERTVRRGGGELRRVYVGTVRKWIGDGSYVWREISPQDTREDAERIARQTIEAGQALEGWR